MLAVEIHEQRAQLAEHRRGGRAPIDPRPGAPLGRHLTAHDQPPLVEIEPEALDPPPRGLVDALERALDDGLGGDGFFSRMREKLHWGDLSERETVR